MWCGLDADRTIQRPLYLIIPLQILSQGESDAICRTVKKALEATLRLQTLILP